MPRRRRRRRLASRVRDALRSFIAFLFSNVGVIVLIVAYTIAGAFIFRAVEGEDEMARAVHMAQERNAMAQSLWYNVTLKCNPLDEWDFKARIRAELVEYQRKVVLAARRGWDGDRNTQQWSFSSAFLYSLTVITTIGYGHLSPRTTEGKILTIFYALLGMPLFLLYLTNVGELLARWFKCIYALICLCRGCPGFRMRRVTRIRTQLEMSDIESIERPEGWQVDPMFGAARNDFRPNLIYPLDFNDTFQNEHTWERFPPYRETIPRDHIDRHYTNRKYGNNYTNYKNKNRLNRYQNRFDTYPPFREYYRHRYYRDMNNIELPLYHPHRALNESRNRLSRENYEMFGKNMNDLNENRYYPHHHQIRGSRVSFNTRSLPHPKQLSRRAAYLRSQSQPVPQHPSPRPARRAAPAPLPPPPPPLPRNEDVSSEFSYVTFDAQTITVPISVCVAIMVGYLIFGSMLFRRWEDWSLLDGSYFCFISLSSIGFGDFVPGERVYTERIEAPFIVCSVYLLLGMALVAMCFNLMQEQVIHYFAGMKRALKRICRCQCKRNR